MKTRVCRLYGRNDIRIETDEVAAPGPGEVVVRIGAGGICGSDLHYYQDGGFGPVRVREPIILGHEVAGTITAVGSNVAPLRPGDRVALNPSRPCHACQYCDQALFQHCLNMRFYGSALRFPHEQGAFRDLMVAEPFQCVKIGEQTSLAEAACAEPLAVCLHARNRAGDLSGKRVLVTGAGPIGSLVVAIARHSGAAEIVVTDLHEATLTVAGRLGATSLINVCKDSGPLAEYAKQKGFFDVAFECSAAATALKTAIATTRPQGTIVQVGVTGDMPVPTNMLVSKEIALIGTHRFHAEYAEAVGLIDSGAIDVTPIISSTLPVEESVQAFNQAADRSQAVKVQLSFN
jgi:L-idonate 5-dehydrogenase